MLDWLGIKVNGACSIHVSFFLYHKVMLPNGFYYPYMWVDFNQGIAWFSNESPLGVPESIHPSEIVECPNIEAYSEYASEHLNTQLEAYGQFIARCHNVWKQDATEISLLELVRMNQMNQLGSLT